MRRIADGHAAVNSGIADDFDVVVTDIFMPGVEGIETIRSLKAARPDCPVIAVSGGSAAMPDFDPLRVAAAMGADAVLVKPFDPSRFVAVVDALVPGVAASGRP